LGFRDAPAGFRSPHLKRNLRFAAKTKRAVESVGFPPLRVRLQRRFTTASAFRMANRHLHDGLADAPPPMVLAAGGIIDEAYGTPAPSQIGDDADIAGRSHLAPVLGNEAGRAFVGGILPNGFGICKVDLVTRRSFFLCPSAVKGQKSRQIFRPDSMQLAK
jgi:hypothetical protein